MRHQMQTHLFLTTNILHLYINDKILLSMPATHQNPAWSSQQTYTIYFTHISKCTKPFMLLIQTFKFYTTANYIKCVQYRSNFTGQCQSLPPRFTASMQEPGIPGIKATNQSYFYILNAYIATHPVRIIVKAY